MKYQKCVALSLVDKNQLTLDRAKGYGAAIAETLTWGGPVKKTCKTFLSKSILKIS